MRIRKSAVLLVGLALAACSGSRTHRIPIAADEVAGVKSPVVSLNGTWKFTLTPPEEFWSEDVDPAGWADIKVPGECLMQGFRIRHNVGYAYKRRVDIPADFAGRRIILRFDGVYSYARVWVNGQFIRDHHGGFTSWDCDITDSVEPGKTAGLTVEVTDRDDEISYGSGYAHHLIGGFLRDVSLLALPQDHLSHLRIETDLDAEYRNAILRIDAGVNLRAAKNAEILFSLADKNGTRFRLDPSRLELTQENPAARLNIPIERPLLWDAEHPNLYVLTAEIKVGGKMVQRRIRRIGFRKVEIAGHKLLVNGRPVKLRGACRHDVHPLLGRRSTRDLDRRDALLAKEANLNFIRTSHYPPSRSFLEFCDEVGLYVEEEAAVCFVGTHRAAEYQKKSFSQEDPDFTDRYLNQLEEMVDRDRNHPCVIIWSIGNENLYGANFQKEYDWVKRADPTRPVMFSYPGKVPPGTVCSDILSMHYPSSDGDLTQYGIVAKDFSCGPIPVIFDEWAHVSCYNTLTLCEDPNVRNYWGESIKAFWDRTFESDGVGGAIWGMIDEVFLLPNGPVGYGPWGIVDGWRRKKPEFWHTKKAYSPVRVLQTDIGEFGPGQLLRIPVHNRFDHTRLSELEIRWSAGEGSRSKPGPDIPPHEKGEILIPAQDWKAGDSMLIQFFKDGRFIDEELIRLAGSEPGRGAVKSAAAELRVEEGEKGICVSGENFAFLVSRRTGLIEEGQLDGRNYLVAGPFFHLRWIKEKPAGNQHEFAETGPQSYVLEKMDWSKKDQGVEVRLSGRMEKLHFQISYLISPDGTVSTDYGLLDIPTAAPAEIGIAYELEDAAWIEWQRKGLWSAYPDGHIGRQSGRTLLGISAATAYREKPAGGWVMDTLDYFLQGFDRPEDSSSYLSNDARSLKENIYFYSVGSKESPGRVTVEASADLAVRLKPADGERIRLIILANWDYPDLGWGNRLRPFKLDENRTGSISIRLE
ncbi:MAG: glycoside hydrolase family 2 TIM barrel-domain containing protein [Candidatus Aminicenantales bacterium]